MLASGWVLNYICVIFLAGVEETKVPTTLCIEERVEGFLSSGKSRAATIGGGCMRSLRY
jgi:hypothetical protein